MLLAEHVGADNTLVVLVLPLVVVAMAAVATALLALRHRRGAPAPAAYTMLGPLPVSGWTGDGIRVRALAFAESEVTDRETAASLGPSRVAVAVEAAVTAELAVTELAELAGPSGRIRLAEAAAQRVVRTLTGHGVTVAEISIERIELDAGPDLLRWAERRAGRPSPY